MSEIDASNTGFYGASSTKPQELKAKKLFDDIHSVLLDKYYEDYNIVANLIYHNNGLGGGGDGDDVAKRCQKNEQFHQAI